MGTTPILISVSELRRDIAGLIEKARRSTEPFFITQYGYITAVLLTPQKYEDLRDAARLDRDRSTSPDPLHERRVFGRLYGPWDWETARLVEDEDEVEAYDE